MHTSALTLSCDWQVCDMLMSPPPASSCSLKRETSDLSLSREDLLVTLECDDLLFSSSVTWKLSHQICIKNLPLETLTTNQAQLTGCLLRPRRQGSGCGGFSWQRVARLRCPSCRRPVSSGNPVLSKN